MSTNPSTKIDFALPLDNRVSIVLYDITGREVKTLIHKEQRSTGYYTIYLLNYRMNKTFIR